MPTIAGDCVIDCGGELSGTGDVRSTQESCKPSPMKRRSSSGSLISPPSPMKTKSSRLTMNSTPNASPIEGGGGRELFGIGGVRSEKCCKLVTTTSPKKQGSTVRTLNFPPSPVKWKSPRRCLNSSPKSTCINSTNGIVKDSTDKLIKSHISLVDKLSERFDSKLRWNPKVNEQMAAVKEALHVSMAPSTIVCREDEHNKVLDFCKMCVEQDKAGSLYVCGCPGTGKSLSVEKVKLLLLNWSEKAPDVLSISCPSLTNTADIFSKILGNHQSPKQKNGSISPLQSLKKMYSTKKQSSYLNMMLIIADELDYLITKDRAVLHDLFMLTTLPYSRCILIGIANAIDLADRFLPKLQSLNCKPAVITFRAYSKDQILKILQQRLMALPYDVFHPQALELCARKVAAASGDMRKALSVCRSAIEMLEAELKEPTCRMDYESVEGICGQREAPAHDLPTKQEINIVRVDHMIAALSRTFKSPILDTIQALPQHQQILLCSAVRLFRGGKKDTIIAELNKFYLEICKSLTIPPAGILELSNMCTVLSDQGLLKLGQSRQDKLKRVTLRVDEADIAFALQGIRLFRNCLQSDF